MWDIKELGPDVGPKRIESWADPRELGLDGGPNSLGSGFRSQG